MNNVSAMTLSSLQAVGEKNNNPTCSLLKTLKSCLHAYVNTCPVTVCAQFCVVAFMCRSVCECTHVHSQLNRSLGCCATFKETLFSRLSSLNKKQHMPR